MGVSVLARNRGPPSGTWQTRPSERFSYQISIASRHSSPLFWTICGAQFGVCFEGYFTRRRGLVCDVPRPWFTNRSTDDGPVQLEICRMAMCLECLRHCHGICRRRFMGLGTWVWTWCILVVSHRQWRRGLDLALGHVGALFFLGLFACQTSSTHERPSGRRNPHTTRPHGHGVDARQTTSFQWRGTTNHLWLQEHCASLCP